MKAKELIPSEITKNTVIRTGFRTGYGCFSKNLDLTSKVIDLLNEQGWAAVSANDAPRGGVTGKHVKVIGRLWSKQTLRRHVAEAIDTDGNYYHGCGVYRLAIADGKITAALYEGYHDSCKTRLCSVEDWANECRRQMEKHGTVVKADGSGNAFYIREGWLEAAAEAGATINTLQVPGMTQMETIHELATI